MRRAESASRAGIGRILGVVLAAAFPAAALADAPQPPARELAIGVLAHDRGPASDRHESGIDLNLEWLFAPLGWLGSPRPHLGVTPNFVGDTSIAYAGLSYRFRDRRRWFVDLAISAAIHDGPLHKDAEGCKENSDCGFGIRVMPRAGLEFAYKVGPDTSVSLFYDHMSHKWIIGGENEGIDHIGLRYRRPF